MFLGCDLMDLDDTVVLGLGGRNGDFAMLFLKIQDVFGRFKTIDDKKARRMIKKERPMEAHFCNFMKILLV